MIDKLKSIKEFKDLNEKGWHKDLGDEYQALCNYIDLLDKTLELGMFVPCVDGVPLKKPIDDPYSQGTLAEYQAFKNECKQYKQAENSVLFKGFEICGGKAIENKELQLTIMLDSMQFMVEGSNGYGGGDLFGENISSLCFASNDIELTEGCKQLTTK